MEYDFFAAGPPEEGRSSCPTQYSLRKGVGSLWADASLIPAEVANEGDDI
jgi:hypothetical protein